MSQRTFKVQAPHLRGSDVAAFEEVLNRQMRTWGVDYQVPEDGDWDVADRDLTATVCHGLGLASASSAMKNGVTPALRVKLRNKHQTPAEKVRYAARAPYRAALRKRHAKDSVARPLNTVIADSWGYHPGVHDGIDLICPPQAVIYSMTPGRVIRADTGGWWGKAPSGDVSKGDGIIIVRCTTNTGPFRVGLNICYGHAENPRVREGDIVKAGDVLGHAGLAVAWHIHLMVNGRNDDRGVGDRDPEPFYRYAMKHG